jgi:hypothetical protein
MADDPKHTDLTAEYVREMYSYDPHSGHLTHKKPRRGTKVGTLVGTLKQGYLRTKANRTAYFVHRIIWLWMTGAWP